ncbi:MAG: PLDc N-terminal domain-containing protein [Clostridium sp.]
MDFKLLIPILVIQFILTVVAIVDLIRRDKSEIKGGNKLIWASVILILANIGPIIYLTVGKKTI